MSGMTDAEYEFTHQVVLNIARSLMTLDLTGFINRIENAQAVGPIMDPTMYRKALRNLSSLEIVAKALLDCQQEIKKGMRSQ